MFNNLIRGALASFGFQISKIDSENVRFDTFLNLAKAHERYLFAGSGTEFSENERRYRLLSKLQGTPPTEAYSILEAIAKCSRLEGDVCEFGVAEGDTSALIANEIMESNKNFHLFDSFEGLPKPTEKDELIDDIFELGSMVAYEGTMSFPEVSVRKRLELVDFPQGRTIIHKGFIENTISDNTLLPKKVSVAYVDFDFYEPIVIALNFLGGVLEVGGIIVVDDYGFFSSGAKTAVDGWINQENLESVRFKVTLPEITMGHYVIIERIQS